MDDVVVERVLRAVELIPSGQVASYGDIAALAGIGPRQVGSIMRAYGGTVAWWRVTSRDGDIGAAQPDRARLHWEQEGIAVKPNGLGCRFTDYRTDLGVLADRYDRAVADLPGPAASPPRPGERHTAG